jgi:hypothetical protein
MLVPRGIGARKFAETFEADADTGAMLPVVATMATELLVAAWAVRAQAAQPGA